MDTIFRTFVFKLQNLSKSKTKKLDAAFKEGLRLYNSLLSRKIRNKESVKWLSLYQSKYLNENIIKGIAQDINDNYGKGKAKYKSFLDYLSLGSPAPSFTNVSSYFIDIKRNSIIINKLGKFRILGRHQILRYGVNNFDIIKAYLFKKSSGYYVHVVFKIKVLNNINEKLQRVIAIDFGLRNKITFSNGFSLDFSFIVNPKILELQNTLEKHIAGSGKRKKLKNKIDKYYERLSNKIKDLHNKIFHYLSLYDYVILQDDYMYGWGNLNNENGLHRLMSLKERIIRKIRKVYTIDRYEATTKICFFCSSTIIVKKDHRRIHCHKCGWACDRDLNAALYMIRKATNQKIIDILDKHLGVLPYEQYKIEKLFGNLKEVRYHIIIDKNS